jgi:ATP-dependent Lhr-like helicase
MARCILLQDIEAVSPVLCPLDVLAQIIVSMTAVETWTRDALYDEIRAAYPFNSLTREHFDLVLAMLGGKYAETRLRELSPLVSVDALDGTVRAREGALLRLYSSGGTIPDRGYFSLRTADTKALVGELDEEFVWERSVGDSFFFGTQGWRINRIDHQSVEVVPVRTTTAMAPFWKAEERNRGFHFSRRISEAFERWTGSLGDPDLVPQLQRDYALQPEAARELIRFLSRQKEATGTELPHRHHLLVEFTSDPMGGSPGPAAAQARREGVRARNGESPRGGGDGTQDAAVPVLNRIVLHTLWGGRVNRPYALALAAAWEEKLGAPPEVIQDDDAILLIASERPGASEIVSLVTPENVERLLRKKLEGSGFFGARFRENASRALLLPKAAVNRRMPLWFARLRAKSLFAAVGKYDDFPMLVETWRTCLRDEFDMESLTRVLSELASGAIRVSEAETAAPSPFCGGLSWKQTNVFMYDDDTPRHGGRTGLRPDLIRELVFSSSLRPQIRPETAAELQEKLQRTAPGYSPRGSRELLEWVKERVLIPMDEWERLLAACQRDHGTPAAELAAELVEKIEVLRPEGESGPRAARGSTANRAVIAAREALPRIRKAMEHDDDVLSSLVSQWLRFYGPVSAEAARSAFVVDEERFRLVLQDLVDEELLIVDRLVAGVEAALICDRENLEALLRITRVRARPSFQPLDASLLPLFIAQRQGLTRRGGTPENLRDSWEKLFGVGLPARMWEEEVFPARLDGYRGAWLDSLFGGSALVWFGCGRERIGFCFREDLELFTDPHPDQGAIDGVFPGAAGKYGFWELLDNSGFSTLVLSEKLWRLAWEGSVSNDSFQTIRRGIENRFRAEDTGKERPVRTGARRLASAANRSFSRWQASRPASGYWFRLPAGSDRDALDEEELNRDKIRQLLARYGVLFREILESEIPTLRWGKLFRSLRIMELSGEVVTSRFFEGVPGLQFASAQAFGELGGKLDEDAVYWMNAADPASLCGVALESMKGLLPSRVPGTHLVFRRQARDLEFKVPAGEERIKEYLGFIRVLASRDARPMPAVHVETINGEPAAASSYKDALISFGFTEDFKRLTYRGGV